MFWTWWLDFKIEFFEGNHIQYSISKIMNIQYSKLDISFRRRQYTQNSKSKVLKRTCYAAHIGAEWWTSNSRSSCKQCVIFILKIFVWKSDFNIFCQIICTMSTLGLKTIFARQKKQRFCFSPVWIWWVSWVRALFLTFPHEKTTFQWSKVVSEAIFLYWKQL